MTAYTVFIDESFGTGFTTLSSDDAYFCYSALMVPTAKLQDLERFWSANRRKLNESYKRATGFEVGGEFKSRFFNKLDVLTRVDFGQRLAYFLTKNDAYVAGFYTTVRNLLLYNLRTETAKDDSATQLPNDWESRLVTAKAKFDADKATLPGDAHLLMWLFHQTVSITFNWLGSGKHPFAVVYDPRQKREDRFVIRQTAEWLANEANLKQFTGIYMGATNTVTSSACPGLMLTDLIVRDVRLLFSDVPELLMAHSSKNLILPEPQGFEPVIMSIKGLRLKWGDRRPMKPELKAKLGFPTLHSTVPLYITRLADHKLSCHAAFGESRVINFGLGVFEDMVD